MKRGEFILNNIRIDFGLPFFLPGILILFFMSCGGAKEKGGRIQDFAQLEELVNSREFEVRNDWLMPLGGNRINLIGNPNYIRFKHDSVKLFLPYFGVRQTGGGYGTEGGIHYEGPAEKLEIEEGKRQNIKIKFRGTHKTENLQFHLTLYGNGKVHTAVNSSQRNAISYQGEVRPLPEEFK